MVLNSRQHCALIKIRDGRSTLYWCLQSTFVDLTKSAFSQSATTYFLDLPQVFKPDADHSSIKLSFCSLPAKIPLVTLLAGLLLFLFDGLQVMYSSLNWRGTIFFLYVNYTDNSTHAVVLLCFNTKKMHSSYSCEESNTDS